MMNAAAKTETLIEAAERHGFILAPSKFEGFKDWFDAADEFVGSFDAHDGWAYIHELEAA